MALLIHVSGPNEALIRTGGGAQARIRVGGRLFVIPIIHRVQRLSLEVVTLDMLTPKVYTKEGVAVSVDGVAQVKVARGEEAIRTAAQQFLSKTREEMGAIALQTMEGHQRAILGTMTVEQIYQDRESFAAQVLKVATPDMANMGLEIVSFTIRDIRDEVGYLDALGLKRTAEVKRDGAIGQAEAERDAAIRRANAERDAGIRQAEAHRDRRAAELLAQTQVADSERQYQLQKAAFDQEVATRKAQADLAYELQEQTTRQQIREQQLQIDVVERRKQTEIQQEEIERRQRELEATVNRPAAAERNRLETVAAGQRQADILAAEAEAQAIRIRGEAEADAIRARGTAEAEAMRLKAEAFEQYGQAAIIDRLLTVLPALAEAVSSPLSQTDRIVMISGDGQLGASKLTSDITRIVSQMPEVLESLTGVDVVETLKGLRAVRTTDTPPQT